MTAGYRPEIDGLRALAVVPVMLFHGGVTGFSGGFVGVDVFFVISGFLITSILLDEQRRGQFSIANFYERRARRILPALFFVALCCIPFAWMWMPDEQLEEFGQSLLATSLFVSNIHFWAESNYFGSAAEEKPLLHTWSLAIEEQFYLLFPLFLALVWRFRKRWLLAATLAMAAASLALALLPLQAAPETRFYLTPFRAWELLAGAALAMLAQDGALSRIKQTPVGGSLAGLGVMLIAATMAAIDSSTHFPGLATLLPVLGTALILAFADKSNWAGKLLGSTALVGIGLISYSAYLWHQPLFAFARLRSLNEPSELLMLGLGLLSLALAAFSWRFVEKPFRDRLWFGRTQVFAASTVAGAVVIGMGAMINSAELTGSRLSADARFAISPPHSKGEQCDWQQLTPDNSELESCAIGAVGVPNPVILWGDSHAAALVHVLGEEMKAQNLSGLYVQNRACRNIPGTYLVGEPATGRVTRCESGQKALLEKLKSLQPRAVLVAMRWTLRVYPVGGAGETLGFDNGEGGREDMGFRTYVARDASGGYSTGEAGKLEAIRQFLGGLKDIGAPVAVVYPVPEVGWHVGNLNFKNIVASGKPPREISTGYDLYLSRNRFILSALDKLVPELGLRSIDPTAIFCDTIKRRCMAQQNGVPLYFDDDHVSETGARMLMAKVLPALGIERRQARLP